MTILAIIQQKTPDPAVSFPLTLLSKRNTDEVGLRLYPRLSTTSLFSFFFLSDEQKRNYYLQTRSKTIAEKAERGCFEELEGEQRELKRGGGRSYLQDRIRPQSCMPKDRSIKHWCPVA